ncbi:FCD domain-containing protein [Microvirga tunisiensis]|uniref:Pyruvate dehydrogenase complex repressor n=1 Tax=Pannonibacter tanglangensis TaxID=2750084 RepID=A0A7X5J8T7_9HYPH|nr:FadR/GntR family transcriptional regulator [Pannonibacter sp. XCT-53]NBN79049.1 FCD domain-containing protein [Pannonibacter sp. XCT-53]
MFTRISHVRTADAVVEQVEALILRGILRPGDRLPAERDLVTQVDVSRPILREALKTLEDRGLLVSRPGGGTYVADLIGSVFSEPLVALVARHPAAIEDYLEFRSDVEALAAGRAAERATAADRALLSRIVEAMAAALETDDHATDARLDVEFHQAIGEAAHNMILLHTLRACYRLLETGVYFSQQRLFGHPGARVALLEQHRAILERILARDAVGARQAAVAHIDFVRSALAEAARDSARDAVSSLRLDRRLAGLPTPRRSRTRQDHRPARSSDPGA